MRLIRLAAALLIPAVATADETFVKIQQVSGQRVSVLPDAGVGRSGPGRGRGGRGRGRGGRGTSSQPVILTVPADAKITTAMRERRTFEFRAGGEIAGGLRHEMFRNMREPLSARIVTEGGRITEVNVITPETDINQSNATASGATVIAIRPKRPPPKRKP